ncbi:hypothetical protein, partial [Limnohabitans sp.]|uniref:hypothetical protein n=1 Tax=Limnohabitans sp. TaxID=1907725 RepID=UPI0037BF087A
GIDTADLIRPRQACFVVCGLTSVSNRINHLRAGSVELVRLPHFCLTHMPIQPETIFPNHTSLTKNT